MGPLEPLSPEGRRAPPRGATVGARWMNPDRLDAHASEGVSVARSAPCGSRVSREGISPPVSGAPTRGLRLRWDHAEVVSHPIATSWDRWG
jgi:hypothetical protein